MVSQPEGFERFCRGCLIHFEEPNQLIQYTEKTRRQFVYATSLEVKRSNTFTVQLCKDCYINMKMTCKFKKQCRTSDKRIKNYLALKEAGETEDFFTFLKKYDDTFRFPFMNSYSTPMHQKSKDDDNESTTTSIRNFMTDMLKDEQIPDTEVNIIREVIEEEADILDDSLDSQWLQDDVSIDTDFNLDFSPFATPRSVCNDPSSSIKKDARRHVYVPTHFSPFKTPEVEVKDELKEMDKEHIYEMPRPLKTLLQLPGQDEENPTVPDSIDKNLQKALNKDAELFPLEDLLVSPASTNPQISTPTINDILFDGKTLNATEDSQTSLTKVGHCIETFDNVKGDDLEQLLKDAADMNFYGSLDPKTEDSLDVIEPKEDVVEVSKDVNEPKEEAVENSTDVNESKQDAMINYLRQKVVSSIFDTEKQDKPKDSRKADEDENSDTTKSTQLRPSFLCFQCGQTFFDNGNYKKHLRLHKTRDKKFYCDFCGRNFSYKSKIESHMRSHMVKQVGTKKVPLPPVDYHNRQDFYCDICGAKSTNSSNLNVHRRRHEKSYSVFCKECGKGFVRKQEYYNHMRTHTAEKPFACTHCDKKFARADTLVSHLRSKHTGERPFECEYCHAKFIKASILAQHVERSMICMKIRAGRTVDPNNPYKCEDCHATFKMANHLKIHMNKSKRCKRIREGIVPVEEEIPKRKYKKRKIADVEEKPKRKYTRRKIIDEDGVKDEIWKPLQTVVVGSRESNPRSRTNHGPAVRLAPANQTAGFA